MTRYVRAGSTQKHKKVPGEATKWGEFDLQKSKHSAETHVSDNERKIKKRKKSKANFPKNINFDSNETKIVSENSDKTAHIDSSTKKTFIKQTHKNRNTNKKNAKPNSESQLTSSPSKVFEKKKTMYLKKLQDKRVKNGILLLPSKIERKIYNIKKRLREKGTPPNIIKEIIRKERRKEELKFRKTFNPNKLCFNCRQPGHILADCPQKAESSNQEIGLCFKCGSSEHTSFKCPKKVQGFPFANCFICKEQGHISKDCPINKHGVYPKGGQCNLCGNVNHLKKDCPSLKKKEADESPVTLHTINEVTSIDEEIIETKETKKQRVNKPKIIKF